MRHGTEFPRSASLGRSWHSANRETVWSSRCSQRCGCACQRTGQKAQEATLLRIASCRIQKRLERLDIFSLQALRTLGDVELHRLALLQALETAGLNSREMHENVLAGLPANKAVTFGVVKPLYCSLFCHVDTRVPFNRFTLEGVGGTVGR